MDDTERAGVSTIDPFAPIHALAPALAEGSVSAAALTELCLERIARLDGRLHAFIAVYAEEARRAAEAADRLRRAGLPLPPLHGIPIALKDLLEIEGRVTTAGATLWRDRVSAATATAVRRLQAAGAVLLGKTHMVEFAFGAWGSNGPMGTPWNPWDAEVHRVPGGSSSGSAVAVAGGLAPAAIGSDTGGSIRIPASQCGLVGLKVTVGRISNHGVVLLNEALDTLGPLTRSVEDAALLFAVLHGPDPADPRTIGPAPVDPLPTLRAGVAGLRLATLPEDCLGEIDPELRDAFAAALAELRGLGARIEPIGPLPWSSWADDNGRLIAAEGYARHRAYIDRDDLTFDRPVRDRLRAGRAITAADYIEVQQRRDAARRQILQRLQGFDALLLPTTPLPAQPLAEIDALTATLSRFTRPGNFLDLCALAVPCGFTRGGLPLSLQIVGRPYDEAGILRLGWAYEAATAWHRRRPPIA
jgi:aspartyl-tRNA(Asn)/glutamyl-tRNA(Gln) amidotransferase subunit A